MCEVINEIISIKEKTRKHKYKFLSHYVPMWNKILIRRGVKRVIIDTHAGTGIVYNSSKKKKIFGSPLIFLQKTCLIQKNLKYYFIEKDPENCNSLVNNIKKRKEIPFKIPKQEVEEYPIKEIQGLKVYKRKKFKRYREGFIDESLITIKEMDCLEALPNILDETSDCTALFFIDPCGALNWKIVKLILDKRFIQEDVKNSEKRIPGTELLINWSWDAILRNPHNPEIISKIYGKDYKLVMKRIKELKAEKRLYDWEYYLKVYLENFQNFEFVRYIAVPFKERIRPTYLLIFCSNNEIADSLVKSTIKKIKIPDMNLVRFTLPINKY